MSRRFVSKREHTFIAAPKDEPWVPFRRDMLESPAWRALSRAGLLLISRLCIENSSHAGKENGRLAVSYDAFEAFGVDRHSIKRTLDEVAQLGFVRCMTAGRCAYGIDPGRVATYRLTFLGTVGDDAGPPTHEWSKLRDADVKGIAASIKAMGRRKPLVRRANGHSSVDHAEI